MAWRKAVLVLLLITRSPLSGQDRGFQPEDYYNIVSVSQVAVSPTGDFVAFTVNTVKEEENTRHQEIWLQPLRNGRPDGEAFRITDPTAESLLLPGLRMAPSSPFPPRGGRIPTPFGF